MKNNQDLFKKISTIGFFWIAISVGVFLMFCK